MTKSAEFANGVRYALNHLAESDESIKKTDIWHHFNTDVWDNDEYADYQDNLCWCGLDFECFNCRNADMPQGGE
jgi:hypothetical protein